MRHPSKMEELLPQELEAAKRQTPVVYLPFAPVEYHGCHVSLNSDTAKGYEMCLRAAKISGGVVHPLLPIAPGGAPALEREGIRDFMQKNNYPGIFVSASLCRQLLLEFLDIFAEDLKFKVCVMCGSHGPAATLADDICQKLGGMNKGMNIITFGSLSHNMDAVKSAYQQLGIPRVSHGGCWETSMAYACGEDFFCPGVIDEVFPNGFENIPESHFEGNVKPTRFELRKASVEFGNSLMDIAAERIAAQVLTLLKSCS